MKQNKYSFISSGPDGNPHLPARTAYSFFQELPPVVLIFSASAFSIPQELEEDVRALHSGNPIPRRGPIVKSEIRDSIGNQLRALTEAIESDGQKFIYVKMNVTTQRKLRTFFSYEVSNPPRTQSKEDKEVGKVVGMLNRAKVVLDVDLQDDEIVPLIERKIKSKHEFIAQT